MKNSPSAALATAIFAAILVGQRAAALNSVDPREPITGLPPVEEQVGIAIPIDDLNGDGVPELVEPYQYFIDDQDVSVGFRVIDGASKDETPWRIAAPIEGALFGFQFQIVPDIDGDGKSDLIVSAPLAQTHSGRGFVAAYSFLKNEPLWVSTGQPTDAFGVGLNLMATATGAVLEVQSYFEDVKGNVFMRPTLLSTTGEVLSVAGTATAEPVMLGADVNLDGVLSPEDMLKLLEEIASGVQPTAYELSMAMLSDITGDKQLTTDDVVKLWSEFTNGSTLALGQFTATNSATAASVGFSTVRMITSRMRTITPALHACPAGMRPTWATGSQLFRGGGFGLAGSSGAIVCCESIDPFSNWLRVRCQTGYWRTVTTGTVCRDQTQTVSVRTTSRQLPNGTLTNVRHDVVIQTGQVCSMIGGMVFDPQPIRPVVPRPCSSVEFLGDIFPDDQTATNIAVDADGRRIVSPVSRRTSAAAPTGQGVLTEMTILPGDVELLHARLGECTDRMAHRIVETTPFTWTNQRWVVDYENGYRSESAYVNDIRVRVENPAVAMLVSRGRTPGERPAGNPAGSTRSDWLQGGPWPSTSIAHLIRPETDLVGEIRRPKMVWRDDARRLAWGAIPSTIHVYGVSAGTTKIILEINGVRIREVPVKVGGTVAVTLDGPMQFKPPAGWLTRDENQANALATPELGNPANGFPTWQPAPLPGTTVPSPGVVTPAYTRRRLGLSAEAINASEGRLGSESVAVGDPQQVDQWQGWQNPPRDQAVIRVVAYDANGRLKRNKHTALMSEGRLLQPSGEGLAATSNGQRKFSSWSLHTLDHERYKQMLLASGASRHVLGNASLPPVRVVGVIGYSAQVLTATNAVNDYINDFDFTTSSLQATALRRDQQVLEFGRPLVSPASGPAVAGVPPDWSTVQTATFDNSDPFSIHSDDADVRAGYVRDKPLASPIDPTIPGSPATGPPPGQRTANPTEGTFSITVGTTTAVVPMTAAAIRVPVVNAYWLDSLKRHFEYNSGNEQLEPTVGSAFSFTTPWGVQQQLFGAAEPPPLGTFYIDSVEQLQRYQAALRFRNRVLGAIGPVMTPELMALGITHVSDALPAQPALGDTVAVKIALIAAEISAGFVPLWDLRDFCQSGWDMFVNGDESWATRLTFLASGAGVVSDIGYVAAPAGFLANAATSTFKALVKHVPPEVWEQVMKLGASAGDSLQIFFNYIKRWEWPGTDASLQVWKQSANNFAANFMNGYHNLSVSPLLQVSPASFSKASSWMTGVVMARMTTKVASPQAMEGLAIAHVRGKAGVFEEALVNGATTRTRRYSDEVILAAAERYRRLVAKFPGATFSDDAVRGINVMTETVGDQLGKVDEIIDKIPPDRADIAENLFGSYAHLRDADGLPQLTGLIQGSGSIPGGMPLQGAVFEAQVAAKIRKGESGAVTELQRVSADGLEDMNLIDTITVRHAIQVKWTSLPEFTIQMIKGRGAIGLDYLDGIVRQVEPMNVGRQVADRIVPTLWLNRAADADLVEACRTKGIVIIVNP